METTRENKDRIDFRVLRGCLVVVVGVVTQTPQILWSLAHFYHARQPTTNKKILGHKNCCRQRHPMRAATLEIQLSWYYKSTIKGCVIKGLQNWFPSALSFNHKTVLPTWKIVNEDRLKYELTMKGILGMFPPVFP